MDGESGAGLLHRLTSLSVERGWDVPSDDPRIRHDIVPNDDAISPPFTKTYRGLPVTPLPRDLPSPGVRATEVLAGHPAAPVPLDAAGLGRILYLGAGITRVTERRGRPHPFRASGSAGARFPLEVYASTRAVAGVPDGVHWYDPRAHALVRVGPPTSGGATTLVVTGVPWRTGWRYAERGWRHLYWDAGTLLAQLSAAAESAGLPARLRTHFPDATLRALVGAHGVHEYPLALLTFSDGVPAIEPTGPAECGELPPVEFPLCTLAQRAGERQDLGDPWPSDPPLDDAPPSEPLDAVILQRGSQRRMDPTRSLSRATLDWSLRAALRGVAVPHWVVVHGVDDVTPGLYRWPDLETPVHTETSRDELVRVCVGQELGGEASFVVIAAVPTADLDDHTYREAQLAAGLVEGRLHVAAYALGAGATGMTFYDSEVPALLREPDDLVTLLFTCVGVPAYRNRRGGAPGAPADFRMVTPKFR
ncbi:hypothetical protein [Cryptosporangium sp. NPDC051539]|uniref:hypothetical protein n=1 Tax=Cryptosporangium sp. NPDC051539 TaxID=3363962 RepID=UPI0037967D39